MDTISSTQFESFEHCIDACQECPVVIEREGVSKAVLVSFETYEYFMELETGVIQLLSEVETEAKSLKVKKVPAKKKTIAKKSAKKIKVSKKAKVMKKKLTKKIRIAKKHKAKKR